LYKSVVALHVNAYNLTVGLKEHFKVIALRGIFVEVNDEECLRGRYQLAAVVFLALDTTIPTCKLGTELLRNLGNVPDLE